ncbi:MAG: hypothetical protein ACKO5E_19895 [bacterium]
MPATYFPIDYFGSTLYGFNTNGSDSNTYSSNTLMIILQNIADGVKTTLNANTVIVYADIKFPSEPPTKENIVAEIIPQQVNSLAVLASANATTSIDLFQMQYSIRVTLRTLLPNRNEIVLQTMTNLTRYLTGNQFGIGIGNKSKIDKLFVEEVETGVYQIMISATSMGFC